MTELDRIVLQLKADGYVFDATNEPELRVQAVFALLDQEARRRGQEPTPLPVTTKTQTAA